MENQTEKCSITDHKENIAVCYCQECKIFMCNKCENLHSGLFKIHHLYKLDKDITQIFTGFCKEEKHIDELQYFCETHNKKCCAAYITK